MGEMLLFIWTGACGSWGAAGVAATAGTGAAATELDMTGDGRAAVGWDWIAGTAGLAADWIAGAAGVELAAVTGMSYFWTWSR